MLACKGNNKLEIVIFSGIQSQEITISNALKSSDKIHKELKVKTQNARLTAELD